MNGHIESIQASLRACLSSCQHISGDSNLILKDTLSYLHTIGGIFNTDYHIHGPGWYIVNTIWDN